MRTDVGKGSRFLGGLFLFARGRDLRDIVGPAEEAWFSTCRRSAAFTGSTYVQGKFLALQCSH
jgi:hypothetical protein